MAPSSEEELTGGFLTGSVTRSGDTVQRSAGPWSPAVHAWLAHLVKTGVEVAPRPLELDLDSETEVISYIDGEVPSGGAWTSYLWQEETLTAAARLIRRFHDAALSFTAPVDARWQPTAAWPGGGEVICHNDLAPWNTVFSDEQPVAFIDWDLAAPGPRWWDVAYAVWHFVPLYGDPASDPFDAAQFEPRAHRTRMFRDAYGLTGRGDLVDMIVTRQRATLTAFKQRADEGDPAYQRLWDMGAGEGIRQQITYVQQHRVELERALA